MLAKKKTYFAKNVTKKKLQDVTEPVPEAGQDLIQCPRKT